MKTLPSDEIPPSSDTQEPNEVSEAPETAGEQSFLLGIFTKDGQLLSQTEVASEQLPALLAATEGYTTGKSTLSKPKKERLPALTSGHRTKLPSTPSFDAIRQSFGPGVGVQMSLWDHTSETRFELTTPNGASLVIAGNSPSESIALYHYVTSDVGPEGLKHLLVLLDTYYLKTGGKDRKADASISVRHLLVRLGKGKKADDKDEQQKLMKTILYLARTLVSSDTKRKASPLLIIEGLTPDEQGNFLIPSEIEYHLGQHFFETLFGKQPQYFSVPTAQLLSYHATREQQELLLAFYLSNQLTLQGGQCSLDFVTLLLQSALQSSKDIQQGTNRTRDAQRVLYALERLEQHGLIVRAPHEDVDTVLAIDLFTGTEKELAKKVSDTTKKRLQKLLSTLKESSPQMLNTRRRRALQRLLEMEPAIPEEQALPLTFTAGVLLAKHIHSHLYTEKDIAPKLLQKDSSARSLEKKS